MIAFGAAAFDGSTGLVTVPFVPDPLIRAAANIVQLNDDWKILYGYAGGATLSRLRVNSASSRLRGFPNINPISATALPGTNPNVWDVRDNPISLMNGENVNLQATNGGAENTIVGLSICRGEPNYNVNIRGLRLVRFTAAITSTAFAWSTIGNVTLDDDLEYGTYGVYGFHVFEADCLLARLVFKDQVERPGTIAGQVVSDRPWEPLYGGVGLLGSFDVITPPFIEAIHVAAAAQTLTGQMLIGRMGA